MKRCLFVVMLVMALAACAKEDVRQSISQAIKKSCEQNSRDCTLNDPDTPSPVRKGAQ